ncbi:MAG: 2-phosphoglycerate kinase [Actinomycetota bacterium]
MPKRTITITEHGLPYSKGLMAGQVMTAGLSPARAYHVAQIVEDRLLDTDKDSVTATELTTLAAAAIREEAGDRFAEMYLKWQRVGELDRPLIVLIGGGTGVGKSTIATQIAARLGIVRIISTDAIREVMKSVVAEQFMPTLYTSSFSADEVVRNRVPLGEDVVLAGFRDQAGAVSAGVRALIDRAVTEGTGMIIEGAHIVPGFIDLSGLEGRAVVVQLSIMVEDEDLHLSHFGVRGQFARARPMDRYVEHFDNIRRIQKFIRSQALSHDVPVIAIYTRDSTLAKAIELIVTTATDAATQGPGRVPPITKLRPNARNQGSRGTRVHKGVAR